MGTYYNLDNKERHIDLLKYNWSIMSKAEFDKCDFEESYDAYFDAGIAVLQSNDFMNLEDIIEGADPVYPDACRVLELQFSWNGSFDPANPLAEYLVFPRDTGEHFGDNHGTIWMNQKEKRYFSRLLLDVVLDQKTEPEETHELMVLLRGGMWMYYKTTATSAESALQEMYGKADQIGINLDNVDVVSATLRKSPEDDTNIDVYTP